MINIIIQVGLVTFSLLAIWLVTLKDEKVRRWGYISGLCSQPFWFYTTYNAEQWGIFILAGVYAVLWINGIRNHWSEP